MISGIQGWLQGAVFAVVALLSMPAVGSAQDHVVPPADHSKMKNAGVNIMPRAARNEMNEPIVTINASEFLVMK